MTFPSLLRKAIASPSPSRSTTIPAQAAMSSLRLQPDAWYSLVADTPDKIRRKSNRAASPSVAIHVGSPPHRQIQADIGRSHGRRHAARRCTGARNRSRAQRPRANHRVQHCRLENCRRARRPNFPAASIPDAGKVFVRLYPGPLSQVIEGMDSILRMPNGCFEQTSSSTYPNVLALDYMKRTKKLTPEVHAKAEGYIANGYQRLLTFEVPGGGFSWFGQAPANKILTAYGLMEFSDMAKVYEVDPRLIQRTQQWLASQQQSDGSWKPDTNFINEGATNRYNSDVLRITAYLAWSLENTGYQGAAVEKARQYIEQHMNGGTDAYTLAVLANFAADYTKRSRVRGPAPCSSLLDASRTEKDEQIWWTAVGQTGVYGRGVSASDGDHRPRRTGAPQIGRGLGHGDQSSGLHRRQEGRQWHVGHHPSHHHGLARRAAVYRKSAADVRGTFRKSRSTASPYRASR